MQVIDRRLNPGGKSLENRQRFIRRAKGHIQRAVNDAVKSRNIADIYNGQEISIPVGGISEPTFGRGGDGIHDMVQPGNDRFAEGDMIPRPAGGRRGGSGSGAGTGDDTDSFAFVLSREEFMNLFLEDFELPDLMRKEIAEVEQSKPSRAGFSVAGSPSNLAVGRTMRFAMSRRIALKRPTKDQEIDLVLQLVEMEQSGHTEAAARLQVELDEMRNKMRRVPYIDPVDVRYRRFEQTPSPAVSAVMFCLMDVSSSMNEHRKDLAKRFFSLLYLFLNKHYEKVELVFIRHTVEAHEVSEKVFFESKDSGGTMVSSVLVEAQRIIDERYNPAAWNIYVAQASDGDNIDSDSPAIISTMKKMLPKLQYFAYLEVADETDTSGFSNFASTWGMTKSENSTVWNDLASLESKTIAMRRVKKRSDIFPVFSDLFKKREVAA